MHIVVEKLCEDENTVTYKFFSKAYESFGIFNVNKILINRSDNLNEYIQLVKQIDTQESPESLFLRAKGAFVREFRKSGIFPEIAYFNS